MLPDKKTARVVWGTPRRAEDVDVATGARRSAKVRRETYQQGCPQIAPGGGGILYEWTDGASARQLMFATALDGSGARPVVKGREPLWLPNGSEFVFDIDQAHAAIFSLPTMSFSRILDGQEVVVVLNWPFGATMSVVLLVIVLALVAATTAIGRAFASRARTA